VEALSPGQPGLPLPGDEPGQAPPRRRLTFRRLLLVGLPAIVALRLATFSDVVGIDAVDDAARVLGACVLLFGLAGFGLTRLCLPDGLRRHELLWILPVGAVAVAFTMTPLGFLGLAFKLNLAVVMAASAVLSVIAWRRRGWPRRPELRAVAWPAYLGLLLFSVALIPLFRSGFATVIGEGSDAHMAAGTAEFLRHNPPLGIDAALPVDQVWLPWRSKQAIYYAFAAVAEISGLETWQVLSTLAALLLSLAAVGMYLLAREMLAASVGAAAVAMALAGLDRMVLHTGMHPYFDQTWGYITMPFAIVLAWYVVRRPSAGGYGLLGLFLAVGALAYPLAVPLPATVFAVMWWMDRRARIARGETAFGAGDLWRRFRALPRAARIGAYLLAFLFLTPAWGVYEKFEGAMQLLLSPGYKLDLWGGDLKTWFAEQRFFAIAIDSGWWIALLVIAGFAVRELRRLPRPAAAGLASILVVGAVIAIEMRLRDYGWYFHFKILAFIGPLVVVLAAVSIARLRGSGTKWVRWGATLMLAVWGTWAITGARDEASTTFDEIPRTVMELGAFGERLPAGASIRLDVQPGAQLWAAYMLADHPLCSQRPLSDTAYPHPPLSRGADYVLVRFLRRPFDAVGAPVMQNKEFRVYRLRPGLPGGDRCSQRFVQTVTRIDRG
jgi:hypothetical protein